MHKQHLNQQICLFSYIRKNAYVVRNIFNNASFIEDYVTEELCDIGCSLEDSSASKIGDKMLRDLFLKFALL